MDVNGGEGLRHRSGGLAQPRWGCGWYRTLTQGSSCLATLGFGTIPRWGIQSADFSGEQAVDAQGDGGLAGGLVRELDGESIGGLSPFEFATVSQQ